MTNLIIRNAWICQVQAEAIVPAFGDVLIRDGQITDIQPKNFSDYLDHPDANPVPELAAGARVMTVPMVNFHEHFYSRLAKGLPISRSMNNFQEILSNLWWSLDRALDQDSITASVQMGALESIRHGVTYIFDHHASPTATPGSLSTIATQLQSFGLRGVLCFETSDRNGPLLADQALTENRRLLDQTRPDVKGMIGLHASFTLSDATLRKAAELVHKYNAGIHIHLCEDQSDRARSLELYGQLPVQRLAQFQLLNPKSILSHGVHLTAEDFAEIAATGSALAYNPDSNLNNAVGLPNFSQAPSDIPILVGTDGMHANIARSLKQLFLLYRHQGHPFDQAFHWLKKIYFDQIHFVRHYFPDFPALQVGDRADLVLWDYIPPTPFSAENFWGHFLYGVLEQPVHSVVQDGQVLMKNHQILVADWPAVMRNVQTAGNKLYQHFKRNG